MNAHGAKVTSECHNQQRLSVGQRQFFSPVYKVKINGSGGCEAAVTVRVRMAGWDDESAEIALCREIIIDDEWESTKAHARPAILGDREAWCMYRDELGGVHGCEKSEHANGGHEAKWVP